MSEVCFSLVLYIYIFFLIFSSCIILCTIDVWNNVEVDFT